MTARTQSILSYLGIFWLIAYFAGKGQRDPLSAYHLKQGLGLLVIGIFFNVAVFIISLVSSMVASAVSYAGVLLLLLMVFGIIHAINEVKKPLPVIGKGFENQFPFLDN
ncbi:DUF4870 domain-containing protein [Parapedobacter lycopersici]|uniref:DUF4870 domain-containing protein n=1 Tax=Parapedobacter lycopersici TaxID=1864939 RepID=UPI00333FDCE7